MKNTLTISLGISLALGCSDSPSPTTADATPGFRFVFNDDATAIAANAIKTRDAYLALLTASGAPAMQTPGIQVDTKPQLVHWNGTNVVLPQWSNTAPQQRDRIIAWTGSEDAAKELYEGLFHWFYEPHELTHFVQQERGMVSDLFGTELLANEMAVAFWRLQPGGQEKLDRLESLVKLAATNITPSAGVVYDATYFDENYSTVQTNVDDYGLLQFTQLLDALKRQSSLDFAMLLTSNIAKGVDCAPVKARIATDCPALDAPADLCQQIILQIVAASKPACDAKRDAFVSCFRTEGGYTPCSLTASFPPLPAPCIPLVQAFATCSDK
jgi:hypothetical protein